MIHQGTGGKHIHIEPLDVAGAVLYLTALGADFIASHVLMVDGGVTASQ
jgi:hypothetical protein